MVQQLRVTGSNPESFEKKLKNSFFAPISHSYYIDRPDESYYHSNKRLLVKGESHIKGRLGMSQGTMNREPKYGGGAHPKYGSCRGLVSPIPRAGM